MTTICFNLSDFPRFVESVNDRYLIHVKKYHSYTEALNDHGFSSAKFDPNKDTNKFSLSDKEFTIFALTWS